ncbi:hypothetical protein [Candidatus Methylocalor cossyra]|uniref:Uncharacterized protein n=1 Tax=Candidatus Methylocalor cossyra TaxID=3108543 RepID=A0ABM9NG10_9GAMM
MRLFPRLSPTATILALYLLGVSLPARAIALNGIIGTWGVQLHSRFTVQGYGQRDFSGSGNCRITLRDTLNAGFSCATLDGRPDQNYSGGLTALTQARKVHWSLDAAGLDRVKANLDAFLVARNLKRGILLTPGNISYEFHAFKYRPIRLSKDLDQPQTASALIKGRVVQLANGKYTVKPFTYQLTIRFLARVP